jgi:hypothetical protein
MTIREGEHVTELPQKAASVALTAPRAVDEGSVVVVRVQADVRPGAAVRGEVELLRTISVRYREPRDGGGTHLALSRTAIVVARQDLPRRVGPESHAGGAGASYDVEVLLAVPADGPASADTALVSVDWALRTRLAVDGEPPTQAVEKIRVLTAAPSLERLATSPPRAESGTHAAVRVDGVASRRVSPGEVITGVVGVAPMHAGLIRTVRIDLVLRERVLRGHAPGAGEVRLPGRAAPDPRKDEEAVVASVELASGVEVTEALEQLRLPFELAVPSSIPAPSVATPYFELTWVLRAVVSRALHRDAVVELDLVVVNLPQ